MQDATVSLTAALKIIMDVAVRTVLLELDIFTFKEQRWRLFKLENMILLITDFSQGFFSIIILRVSTTADFWAATT